MRRIIGASASANWCRSMGSVRLDDFDFPLPRELIADRPCEPRDAARLLVIPAEGGLERISIGRHRDEQPPSPFPLPPQRGEG